MGDSELGNMVPMLSGLTEDSFKRSCSLNQSEFCPFLWRVLPPGQLSMLLMNAPTGLNFRYPPTDLYPETFAKVSGVRSCSASKKALNYVSKLFTCARSPIFATVWLSDATDIEVAQFLEKNRYIFSSVTLVLYMADVFHIVTPSSLMKKHPDKWINLRYNSRLLTTPLDVYATLQDLLLLDKNDRKPLGTSLFSRVSRFRKCNDLGIPHHICKCRKYTPLSLSDPFLFLLAKRIVEKLCPGTPVNYIQQALRSGDLYYLVIQTPGDTFEGTVQLNYTEPIVHQTICKICSCQYLK